MAAKCAAAADLPSVRPRKRARLGWDVAPATEAQIRALYGQEVGDVASLLLSAHRFLQNLVMQHVDHSAGDFIDLLKGLLAYEQSNRLTAQEALRHRFFHNI